MSKDKNKHVYIFKKIGENIRFYRKMKNLSQEELAFKISSARNYIGCIERAEKYPSLSILYDIAQALDVSIHVLISGTTE